MGSRAVSPGGALLRSSRLFSLPKALPEPESVSLRIGDHKSETMTRHHPQHQAITSPYSSREKGDWGVKRPFPVRTTLATSTPILRVKQVDSIENVTDIDSAADHALSLQKFQEMHVALSTPLNAAKRSAYSPRTELFPKSVFEEDMDVTDFRHGRKDNRRWKFEGPWLARMTEGQLIEYIEKSVRPNRTKFRDMLKTRLAEDITTSQTNSAMEEGKPPPPPVKPEDISAARFTDYLRALRNDRVTLYALISKFLDLAPLGQPAGIIQTFWAGRENAAAESPWGKAGPPSCHPSAGISYLRTGSYMENHPVYGPQSRRSPIQSRVIAPRNGGNPVKLGLGGFVADAPLGDNEFNVRYGRWGAGNRKMLKGALHLDLTTRGGAKAYVEPHYANVDPSGKVVLTLRETSAEAQLIARESEGRAEVYQVPPTEVPEEAAAQSTTATIDVSDERMRRVSDEILPGET